MDAQEEAAKRRYIAGLNAQQHATLQQHHSEAQENFAAPKKTEAMKVQHTQVKVKRVANMTSGLNRG